MVPVHDRHIWHDLPSKRHREVHQVAGHIRADTLISEIVVEKLVEHAQGVANHEEKEHVPHQPLLMVEVVLEVLVELPVQVNERANQSNRQYCQQNAADKSIAGVVVSSLEDLADVLLRRKNSAEVDSSDARD